MNLKRAVLLICFFMLPPHTAASLPLNKPNVLIITVDCLRFDHMGLYGYKRDTTPHIDRFFAGAARFNQAVGQSSWTSPSILSILTSLYPSVHGMDARGKYFDETIYTPLKQLREEGYVTLGYDTSQNYADPGWSAGIGKTPLLETLKKHRGDNFFAWFHFREPHLPYSPPEPFKSAFFKEPYAISKEKLRLVMESEKVVKGAVAFDESDKLAIRDLYDAEVLYQDSLLAPIFDFLAASGLLENTIVILTADHGEELLEHGFIGHASTSESATVYDEVTRIPLLIKIPGNPAEPVEDIVRQIDIMPTLFDLMGLKPKYPSQGSSLLPLILKKEKRPDTLAFIETSYCGWQCPQERLKERIFAVRSASWKFVEERKPAGTSHAFYDLLEDPGETKNLYGKKDTGEYQEILSAWQKENLRMAKDRAMTAANKHLAQLEKSPVHELEQVLRLDEIYRIENPSFVDDPELGESWKALLQNARQRLLRYQEK